MTTLCHTIGSNNIGRHAGNFWRTVLSLTRRLRPTATVYGCLSQPGESYATIVGVKLGIYSESRKYLLNLMKTGVQQTFVLQL